MERHSTSVVHVLVIDNLLSVQEQEVTANAREVGTWRVLWMLTTEAI